MNVRHLIVLTVAACLGGAAAAMEGGPDAPVVCDDGIDSNCDGVLIEDIDDDGDGHDECQDGDCDDTDPVINPGAAEMCNDGVDNDCDELMDGEDPDCEGDEGGCDCSLASGGPPPWPGAMLLGLTCWALLRRKQDHAIGG